MRKNTPFHMHRSFPLDEMPLWTLQTRRNRLREDSSVGLSVRSQPKKGEPWKWNFHNSPRRARPTCVRGCFIGEGEGSTLKRGEEGYSRSRAGTKLHWHIQGPLRCCHRPYSCTSLTFLATLCQMGGKMSSFVCCKTLCQHIWLFNKKASCTTEVLTI